MNCLLRFSSYAAVVFGRTSHSIALHQCAAPLLLKRSFDHIGVRTVDLGLLLTRFRVQCYASQRVGAKASRKRKLDPPDPIVMEKEKEAFYVVRKGDVVGVYKSLTECQAQVGSSICDPPVSVYKGYSLSKETEDYLVSRGLQNALYTVRAADVKEDLFGTLVPCPFQQPSSSKGEKPSMDVKKKRSQEVLGSQTVEVDGSLFSLDPSRKHIKLDSQAEAQHSCIIEFDGAAKGNPGPAGAGAVLRTNDGSLICRLREGLGITTNNVAEYRAMILGLKYAIRRGYKKVHVQGDSKLVCSQVQGLWKVKHHNMTEVYEQVTQLKDKFISFKISHVLREFNSEADAQANLAVKLADGQVQVEEL